MYLGQEKSLWLVRLVALANSNYVKQFLKAIYALIYSESYKSSLRYPNSLSNEELFSVRIALECV